MPDIARIQHEIAAAGADGWLFYDFRNRDLIAYQILGLDFGKFTTRRWFYWIPATGEPVRIVSAVESGKLDPLPGAKRVYRSWRELHATLKEALGGAKKVAMQYTPMGNIPYVAMVDAGTVELLTSFGYEVVSSAGLVQTFQAVLSDEALATHVEAGEKVVRIKDEAFALVGTELRAGRTLTQYDVQQFIVRRFAEEGLDCMARVPDRRHQRAARRPALRADACQRPPDQEGRHRCSSTCGRSSTQPGADLLRHHLVRFRRQQPAGEVRRDLQRGARRAATPPSRSIRERFAAGAPALRLGGRRRLPRRGREGRLRRLLRPSHGSLDRRGGARNGVNIDNLETRDERLLVPGVCFSIEPGIYLAGEMAVRSEINVFITHAGSVEVAGPMQRDLILVDVP